ncbi:hypothetical protein BCR42DRAFT_448613 [Absidia repens]|uniref:Yeast cell wall synthesis Kre9/Knh1-like N-terminal domain-containing protein n=1 Tax=Absidia repens TaxID=90262 RepID=A0A1X2IPU7_9FUNG|nr:hypothetical protein BCR42DRAFT_448613 [Absidia repens]
MFKSILVAIATAALATAQIISVTSPLDNNVYTAGGQALITWVNPTVDVIPQIQLSKGPSTALQPVMSVATNVNAKDMQLTWNIPATVAPGSDYAFVFGISPDLAYTGQFTIKAADGTAPPASSGSAASSGSTPAASSGSSSKPSNSAAGSSSAAASSAAASSQPSNAGGKVAPVAVSAVAVVGAAAIALM